MKNTYSATIKMQNAEQLAAFIDSIGPLVESVVITTTPVEGAVRPQREHGPPKKAAPPKVRASKVNDAILATLRQHGEASVRELKEALEAVHLSAGSLSTGIAALTKSGQIERVREGVYGLVAYEQAAE
jgi:DNA-binding transcriptional ArsR family regulator